MTQRVDRMLESVNHLGGSSPTPQMRYMLALIRPLIATATPEIAKIAPTAKFWNEDVGMVIDEACQPQPHGMIHASDAQAVVLHLQASGFATTVDTTGWKSPRRRGREYEGREHVWLIGELAEALFREMLEDR